MAAIGLWVSKWRLVQRRRRPVAGPGTGAEAGWCSVMWIALALGKAIRGVVRFAWRPLLAVLILVGIWAMLPGQGREATTGWFVLAGLLVVLVVEVAVVWWGPTSAQRWVARALWVPSWRKARRAVSEWSAHRAGMRLLRTSGLVSAADVAAGVDVPGVRFYPHPAKGAPYAFIPPLVGVGPDRVQAAMEAVAWQVAGSGSTVEVEQVLALRLQIVRFRRAPAALPDLVPFPSGLRPTIDRLPVGVDVDGNQVTVRLRESNALVAGLPGGGKSAFLNALIASAVGCGPSVALYGIDAKRVELAAWRGTFTRIATEDDDFLPLLNDLADEMNSRYAYLEQRRLRKFEKFTAAHPLIVLVIDELAEVVSSADSKRDKAHAAAIRLLVQKGRAAGICVIAATQRPSSDVIPTSLRDLFVQRVAFATSTVEMSRMILGDGARSDEPSPESIGANERGVGFVTSDGDRGFTRFKAYWVSDEAVKSLVDSLPANGNEVLSA